MTSGHATGECWVKALRLPCHLFAVHCSGDFRGGYSMYMCWIDASPRFEVMEFVSRVWGLPVESPKFYGGGSGCANNLLETEEDSVGQ